jgi:RNA polymerase sigma-70 factor, ECF subfamily
VGATAFVPEISRPRAPEPHVTRPTAGPPPGPGPHGGGMDERLREFVHGEYRQVVATVELVCGSLATAEDSVQEALARAWERDARGEVIDRLPAWVTTVALNLAKSQMRRWRTERNARARLAPLQRDLPDAPGASGDAHAVREALRALPRRQREVTALRYYFGLDVAAIAAWLGIGEGTVKAQLFKARQALAVALGDDDGEEVDHAGS